MKIKENHFYFTSDSHNLYGMLYEPEIDNQQTENYIILHPFAEEKKSSQKVLVDLARRLCEKGNFVLLFDFYGCGDSEGELSNAGFSIWLEDIKQASFFLRKKTKINGVNIIGLRLGAFLGCLYANKSEEINKLILLEPVINPAKDLSRSLRSKLMKELCTDGEITSNRNDLLTNLNNNISVDFSGHEISADFYKDLQSYNAFNPYESLTERGKKSFLINLSLTGKPSGQFQELLANFGESKIIRAKIIKIEPFWSQIDLPDCSELIKEVVEWCNSNGGRKPETVDREDVNGKQLKVNSSGNQYSVPSTRDLCFAPIAGDQKVPPAKSQSRKAKETNIVKDNQFPVIGNRIPNSQCPFPNATIPNATIPNATIPNTQNQISNSNFKESFLTIQNGNDKIFGILTEPQKDNSKSTTIIFLHGWAGYRIGPHRMIVDYARKLAGLGFYCVRFDFRGKGFSKLDKESNSKTQLSDLECVLNFLKQFGLPARIVLTGVCSGARLALYYAMKGEITIDGVIELSTPLLRPENQTRIEFSRSKYLLGMYFSKFFKKETWIKFFNKELKFRLIYSILKNPIMNSLKFLFRKKTSVENTNYIKNNDAFLNFKGEILAIHGEKDPETEVALKQVMNLTSRYSIPFEKHIIKGANHSFYSIDWKNAIFDIIQHWLDKRYSVFSHR